MRSSGDRWRRFSRRRHRPAAASTAATACGPSSAGDYPELERPRCRVHPRRHRRSGNRRSRGRRVRSGLSRRRQGRDVGAARAVSARQRRGDREHPRSMRRHGVRKLVFTSSPSVVHGGDNIEGADGVAAVPGSLRGGLPRDQGRSRTSGPRRELARTLDRRPEAASDLGTRTTPPWCRSIVDRARSGQLRLVGDGSNLIDTVYIDNAVDAHLLAAERLGPDSACAGRAYFITNDDPRPIREIINGFVTRRRTRRRSRRPSRWGWPLPPGGSSRRFTVSFRHQAGLG